MHVGGKLIMDVDTIIVMLEKAGVQPFLFGGSNESYFWRATKIDDEIFVERAWCDVRGYENRQYRSCLDADECSRQDIYDDIVLDLVMYHSGEWYINKDNAKELFNKVADENDDGLRNILDTFDKSYAEFMNDVLLWYDASLNALPGADGRVCMLSYERLSESERIAKHIVDRLASGNTIIISQENTTFVWTMVESHGRIWFSKRTYRSYKTYDFCTEEYGSVDKNAADEYGALQDIVKSCFAIEGYELSCEGEDPGRVLNIIGLTPDAV
jgi:hypothetical protein